MIITPKDKEKKRQFVDGLRELLRTDERSELSELKYEVTETDDSYEEEVKIYFAGGGFKRINVTGDSLYAILLDVAKAVYV